MDLKIGDKVKCLKGCNCGCGLVEGNIYIVSKVEFDFFELEGLKTEYYVFEFSFNHPAYTLIKEE
jgi:hypothetical protein